MRDIVADRSDPVVLFCKRCKRERQVELYERRDRRGRPMLGALCARGGAHWVAWLKRKAWAHLLRPRPPEDEELIDAIDRGPPGRDGAARSTIEWAARMFPRSTGPHLIDDLHDVLKEGA